MFCIRKGHTLGLVVTTVCLVLLLVPPSGAANVKITYAHWGENPGYRAKVEAFNAMQDQIEVEFVPKRAQLVEIVGGVGPDAFTLHAQEIADWAGDALLRPLDPFYSKDKTFLADVFPPAVAQVRLSGHLWALPHYLSGLNGMWYNRTRFSEAGVPFADQSWTWDDELQAARKLVRLGPDGQITQWAFTAGTVTDWRKLLLRALTAGGQFVDTNGQFVFGDAAGMRAARWMVELARLQGGGDLRQGNVAMHGAGISWQEPIRTSRMYEQFEVGSTVVPKDPVTGNRSKELGNNVELIGMNPNTKYPEETWELMKYMLSQASHEAVYQQIGYVQMVPAKRSVATSRVFLQQTHANLTFDFGGFIDSWALHAVPLQLRKWGEVHSVINTEWGKAISGQQPVEAFFAQIRQLVPPILAGSGQK